MLAALTDRQERYGSALHVEAGSRGVEVRVQLEGWVRESDLAPGADASLGRVTAAEVRADPPRYIGRTVEWRLELIAVQTADELRIPAPIHLVGGHRRQARRSREGNR